MTIQVCLHYRYSIAYVLATLIACVISYVA